MKSDDDDDITFRLPARPPALWLAIMAMAIYTGGLYATDPQVWPAFRVIVPVIMAFCVVGSAQILRNRWRERQQRRERATRGPDIERIV